MDKEKFKEIELTEKKSREQADLIEMMKPMLLLIDVEYLKAWAKGIRDQASWQDSAAVLNPNYDPDRQNSMRKAAEAIEGLVQFIECQIEKTELDRSVERTAGQRANIQSLFM